MRAVIAESLHHHPLEHGYHHERYFVGLPPLARAVLGLCFCRHCSRRRGAAGDGGRHRRAAFDAEIRYGPGTDRDVLDGLLDGHLTRREARVPRWSPRSPRRAGRRAPSWCSSTPRAPRRATRRDSRGGPAPEIAWQAGVDVAAVARAARGIGAIAYAADPARSRSTWTRTAPLPGRTSRWRRAAPARPDCTDAANLAEKLAACRRAGRPRRRLLPLRPGADERDRPRRGGA